jgi:hypothetical protein
MKIMFSLAFVMAAGLAACGRPQGLYADRSIPVVAPAASAETAPPFVGRWTTAGQCQTPMVIAARSLSDGAVTCDFDRVEASSAGYSIATVCHAAGHSTPGRLLVMLPDPVHVTSLTLSGGPFSDAVAVQRCQG